MGVLSHSSAHFAGLRLATSSPKICAQLGQDSLLAERARATRSHEGRAWAGSRRRGGGNSRVNRLGTLIQRNNPRLQRRMPSLRDQLNDLLSDGGCVIFLPHPIPSCRAQPAAKRLVTNQPHSLGGNRAVIVA